MPFGGADDAQAATVLPEALVEARRLNAAARFAAARELAAPVFHQARDDQRWAVAAEAALLLARASGNLREQPEALRWVHEATQAATVAARPDLVCAAWVEAARVHARDEDGARAQHAIEQARSLVPTLATPEALEAAYSALTAVYSELGLTSLSVDCARRALWHAERSGEVARQCMARTNLLIIGGVACEQSLEPDAAGAQALLDELLPQLERLRGEVREVASPLAEARLLRIEGSLAVCRQQWAEAVTAFERLTGYAAQLPAQLLCSAWIELGQARRRLGQHDAARESGVRAQACNPVPEDPRRWVDQRRLALILDLLGRSEEAFALLRRSQDRRHHIVMAALESRAATLSTRLAEQALRLENEGLRRSNASLRASVADIARLAETDPLTGLLNRRGLATFWRDLPKGPPRALAMIDVDHFKRVNDSHSHVIGDAVLRQVARLMSHELRGSDRMARYGGEEFAAVVVADDEQALQPLFERLRRVVAGADWSRLAPGLAVTVSIGVVCVRADEPFEQAATRADQRLYRAKADGRDRVCIETGVEPAEPGAGGPPPRGPRRAGA